MGAPGQFVTILRILEPPQQFSRPEPFPGQLFSVHYFCRFRRLFLPVHLLFPTPLLGHSGAVAGDVEFQDPGHRQLGVVVEDALRALLPRKARADTWPSRKASVVSAG